MTDLEKPKPRAKQKPPTQTAGVTGIDGHGGMGEAPKDYVPIEPTVNWFKLVDLPAFQMFVAEQSGLTYGVTMSNWIKERRAALSDSVLYEQYASWHEAKGYWVGESPLGCLK